jgi:quinol-cytochrome oxidoreductase complex cytochrome b subunit
MLSSFIFNLKQFSPFAMKRLNNNYLFAFIANHLIYYLTLLTLTYAWGFGFLAGMCLLVQLISGIFLAMHYTPHIDLAFSSVEYIMRRDVTNGWFIRYVHANEGFYVFYSGLFSYFSGFVLWFLYKTKRNFMVYWSHVIYFNDGNSFYRLCIAMGSNELLGATVITSMFTVIPVARTAIVEWLWGGFTVNNPTLNIFFSIHFILPFLIAGVTLIHLALLHKDGSNNPIGSDSGIDDVPFYPYFVAKDMFAFFCFLLFFGTFVFNFPNVLNHPDNCIPADPTKTPAHVVPEWYFLPFMLFYVQFLTKLGEF